MTFTRKTGPKRPVENEPTVEVEVTRPKRNVKKTVVAADLPETSQRPRKKRVQEGSAVSPPKRRKPAVQPPPKPAAPKARSKVKAPKRPKRERADSVEAVAVEAVEKERSSEGPWLIKRYYKVDVVSNDQWAYMKPEDICGAFAGISEFYQRRLGLRGVITREYVPPNVPLCKEWLLSFDGGPQRDCSATVQGQRIVLTEEMFRDAFFIPEELNPGASSHPFPKHVMRSALEDWFSRYDEKAKRYLAEDCCVRDEMMQVKKHLEQPNNSRLRETFGQVLTHLLIHLGIYKPSPKEDLDDDTQVILHEEVGSSKRRGPHGGWRPRAGSRVGLRPCAWAVTLRSQAQGRAAPHRAVMVLRGPALGCAGLRPRRRAATLREALLGAASLPPLRRPDVLEPEMQQRLLHALQTEGQMDVKINAMKAELAELERLVAEERRLLEETAHRRKEEERRLETLGANVYQPRLVDPESVRRKMLILAFDGLLVSIKSSAEEHSEVSQHGWVVLQVKKGCFVVVRTGLSEFLHACLRDFHLMIWTSRPRAVIDHILRFLFKSKKISFDPAHHENCTVWSREQCFELGKTSRPIYYKDFDNLYEYNISARDVLIVEDEVTKINTNNLMNALVPRRWDLSVETPSSSFLIDHLLPFLTTWRSSVKATVYFIEETRPWATLPWVEEPVETLMKFWGPDIKKTKTWTDVLFRSCTFEERKNLRQIWTSITVRQTSRVESVAPVEGATPVESDAHVESATHVLSAAPVAIEQPSAPISGVVDVASVPSTS
ncbi:hypothetical protein R1sor_002106 [Riccia sorocarpa]|uniref:FCP1 homology domain-containing protein n=1 Tax=Riccia sorocarpa TaxID=122646 RepID=A0ABD3H1U3_9MARC